MLNVFVCTEHCELLARLIALQDQKQDFHIQGFSSSASLDLAFLVREEIAVIYVQFSLIEQRWRQWLDALQTLRSDRSIHLILSFSSLNEAHMAILLRYSIDDYLLEPFDVRQLYALIHAADMPNSYLQLFHGDPTSRKVIMYVYTYLKGIV